MDPTHLDWRLPFPAKLTARTSSSGTYLYSWIEQVSNPLTGALQDAQPPRYGTDTVAPAYELNNEEVSVADEPVVWMRFRGMRGGMPTYEFMASDGMNSPGGNGGSVWVVENVCPIMGTVTIDLADEVTGVLPPAQGGTGTSDVPAAGEILVGDGTGNYAATDTLDCGTW